MSPMNRSLRSLEKAIHNFGDKVLLGKAQILASTTAEDGETVLSKLPGQTGGLAGGQMGDYGYITQGPTVART